MTQNIQGLIFWRHAPVQTLYMLPGFPEHMKWIKYQWESVGTGVFVDDFISYAFVGVYLSEDTTFIGEEYLN